MHEEIRNSYDPDRLPSVSVVIPSFNARLWVERAVESALAQRGVGVDVVVVDDGSTDGSADALRRFEGRVRVLVRSNAGAAAARNRGLREARAEWLLFLDADDYLEDGVAQALLRAARRTVPTPDLVIGTSVSETPDGERHDPVAVTEELVPDQLFDRWLRGAAVQTGGILWSRAFLSRIGGWNEHMRIVDDLELMVRAVLLGAHAFSESKAPPVVWCHHASPFRIQNAPTIRKIEEIYFWHEGIAARANQLTSAMKTSLARHAYLQARLAFSVGEEELGTKSLHLARHFGLRHHPGTFGHRVFASTFGLDRKERLRLRTARAWSALWTRLSHGAAN